jgi:type I restriction-modification system DNA methylase subunit
MAQSKSSNAKSAGAKSAKDSTANLGFEAKLWLAADKLRNNMDAAEYKHVVLGLIFLKYISDTFEEHRADLTRITSTYHAWRGDKGAGTYADVAGFCKSASTADIAAHGHVLTPGRYVGAEEVEEDGEPFEEKMKRLTGELASQFAESAKLEAAIRANLKGLGYAF